MQTLMVKIFLTIFFTIFLAIFLFGSLKAFSEELTGHSKQLILVTVPESNSLHGHLQRYQRDTLSQRWHPIGSVIRVVVGKNGVAWGVEQDKKSEVIKKEGDNRTPAGVYSIGTVFGFVPQPKNIQQPYMQLNENSICVDDKKSKYYNQLIDAAEIKNSDWDSGEKMWTVPFYKQGAMVMYNMPLPIKGGGSCIFLHIWRSPDKGTAGCIAMAELNLVQVLTWLDPYKRPVIAIFPKKKRIPIDDIF